ncbi:hypothetical protein M9194_20440 [Vibrio sp. S4M6]|uniref:hypothetical protein n=1 Tax=Vibrio sinus TaxID=2946865 RepID=UPI00202A0DFA|nr:hypothetical protein [Vibrio sinus]MCL9783798.1 hypothetical protein [Vibrio sinus]
MNNNETFHRLVEQLFNIQGLDYTPSDVYHLKLDAPQVDSMLVAFLAIDDQYAALVSEIKTSFVTNKISEWLLRRNSFKKQMAASYCMIEDEQHSPRVMAQIRFNYQKLELPEALSLYEAFTQEISRCSQELQNIEQED